ncbi:hypothetical protein F5Y07DRAFT_296606 [Xylaria sp. FL0933]|nr:hypothetical protein F5Y07DRAFT_296606 [Xylaria sp. FL0933]
MMCMHAAYILFAVMCFISLASFVGSRIDLQHQSHVVKCGSAVEPHFRHRRKNDTVDSAGSENMQLPIPHIQLRLGFTVISTSTEIKSSAIGLACLGKKQSH